MSRTLITGGLLAIAAAALLLLGRDSQLEAIALLSASLGAVLGLAPGRVGLGRYIGFVAGFIVAWMGFAVRAALLPDTAGGRAVAAVLVIGLATVITLATLRRIPLWSQLLGIATLVGAYEHIYAVAPARFLTESPSTATTALLAAGLGMFAGSLAAPRHTETDPDEAEKDLSGSTRTETETQTPRSEATTEDSSNRAASERDEAGEATGDQESSQEPFFRRPRRDSSADTADDHTADTDPDQTAARGGRTRLNDLMGLDR